MNPLLSIVIPTKDRYQYLKYLIELIDSFNSDEIEVIVQDNTYDNSEILSYLSNHKYKNLKYYYTKEAIPISLNSDKAILNSMGEYVCFIGDDDGVTRDIIPCVKWMKERGVDALTSAAVSYNWPDAYNTRNRGILRYNNYKSDVHVLSIKDVLHNVLNEGCIDRGLLPVLYHGIVKRDSLNKIYQVGGTFFPGPSPDMANGIAVSLVIDSYVYLDYPIIVAGAGSSHGGGKLIKDLSLENKSFLPKDVKENWESNIPKAWSGVTVWCESAVKALRYMGRLDLISQINFENMYAYFLLKHVSYLRVCLKLSNNKIKLILNLCRLMIKRYSNAFINIVKYNIFHRFTNVQFEYCNNIKEVADKLQSSKSIINK